MALRNPQQWLEDAGQGPLINTALNSPTGGILNLNSTNNTQIVLDVNDVRCTKPLLAPQFQGATGNFAILRSGASTTQIVAGSNRAWVSNGFFTQNGTVHNSGTPLALALGVNNVPVEQLAGANVIRYLLPSPVTSATIVLPSTASIATTVFQDIVHLDGQQVNEVIFEIDHGSVTGNKTVTFTFGATSRAYVIAENTVQYVRANIRYQKLSVGASPTVSVFFM